MNEVSFITFDPLNANPTKWSNTLKQFVGNLPTNCLSVFDHFVGLALKGLKTGVPNIVRKCFCSLLDKKSNSLKMSHSESSCITY